MKQKYLTINLQGGLGNQLFQFAFAYLLAKKNKMKLRFNVDLFKDNYRVFRLNEFKEIRKLNIPVIKKINFFSRLILLFELKIISILKLFKKNKYQNFFLFNKFFFEINPFFFDKKIYNYNFKKNIIINGFFQTEKYFISERKLILKLLKFPKKKNLIFMNYYKKIKNSNSIAIHFRRGDYVNNIGTENFHGNLSLTNYYSRTISYFKKHFKNSHFFIFSDDLNDAKNFFSIKDSKYTFVEINSDIESMCLMSMCKHFIIANSSFSWWAAWLCINQNKIICSPKKWIKKKMSKNDILPISWKKF
jgi:hypothetical protein